MVQPAPAMYYSAQGDGSFWEQTLQHAPPPPPGLLPLRVLPTPGPAHSFHSLPAMTGRYPVAETNPKVEARPLEVPLAAEAVCPQPRPEPVPAYAQHPFGPKPVRKPKGPFRAGDPQQALQQQQYEAYLEWKRTSNTDYAQQCKARQARRAERQSKGNAGSGGDEPAHSLTGSKL